jgi:endo-1,4-beta-xylanase
VNYENALSFNGEKCLEENMTSFAKTTDNGYVVEAAFKWTETTPAEGARIGLELQINDADSSGMRIGTLSWYDESGQGWSNPGVYGVAELAGEGTAVSDSEPVADAASDEVESDEGAVSDQTAAVIAVLLLGGSSAALVAQRKKKAGEANKESDKKDETKEE